MLMSMFSPFDALSAESSGQKVGFSWGSSKQGKVVEASTVDHKVAPSPMSHESKGKAGNSTEPAADVGGSCQQRQQRKPLSRRPRFAPELDGVYCFETIVPY